MEGSGSHTNGDDGLVLHYLLRWLVDPDGHPLVHLCQMATNLNDPLLARQGSLGGCLPAGTGGAAAWLQHVGFVPG